MIVWHSTPRGKPFGRQINKSSLQIQMTQTHNTFFFLTHCPSYTRRALIIAVCVSLSTAIAVLLTSPCIETIIICEYSFEIPCFDFNLRLYSFLNQINLNANRKHRLLGFCAIHADKCHENISLSFRWALELSCFYCYILIIWHNVASPSTTPKSPCH